MATANDAEVVTWSDIEVSCEFGGWFSRDEVRRMSNELLRKCEKTGLWVLLAAVVGMWDQDAPNRSVIADFLREFELVNRMLDDIVDYWECVDKCLRKTRGW